VSEASGLLVATDASSAPLAIKSQRVGVEITDSVATTTVEQVFVNGSDRPREAVYIFPLPEGAAVSSFSMWIGGEEIKGEVMEKRAARGHYNAVTRPPPQVRPKDPAILEHLQGNTFSISVSPVPARGEQRIRLVYTQVVPYKRGIIRYTYPLRTKRAARTRLRDYFALTAHVRSAKPILHVYSPTHPVDVCRADARSAVVGLEEPRSALDRDFSLLVSLGERRKGVATVTYRHSADENGYFMALVALPERDRSDARLAKDIVFAVDTSGSMEGRKIARKALRYCVKGLGAHDRFNIIRFATGIERLSSGWVRADKKGKADAERFVGEFKAAGGTFIEGALDAALEARTDPKRPAMVLFLTDGIPTVGLSQVNLLIEGLAARKKKSERFPRIYVFGVGDDVNTKLLDSIAELSGASRAYVEPGEKIDEEVADLYDRIRSPLLADLVLTTPGLNSYDVFPAALPALYEGRQIVVTGRYRGSGDGAVKVTGTGIAGETVLIEETVFPAVESREAKFLPRLWAVRKIGELLDAIRLGGEKSELVREVVSLSKKHGVMTPYTSYLVLESERMYRDRGITRARRRDDGTKVAKHEKFRAKSIEHPVLVHEEPEEHDHMETENNASASTARGQEDAISDVPLGGTGVTGNLGIGGGGAGAYGFRSGGGRRRAAMRGGGSRRSESAVARALEWLWRHQEADGRWNGERKFEPDDPSMDTDPGVTGLAVLAFLGAGHTEKSGLPKYQKTLRKAVAYLVSQQDDEGCIGAGNGLDHAMAGLALAEAYGMARVRRTGTAAQKAVDYSITLQADYSGWGHTTRAMPNTLVTGWFVMQLKSAMVAGLRVDGKGFQGAIAWLDKVTHRSDPDGYGGNASYQPHSPSTPTMTAVAMVGRQFMGWKRTSPLLIGGARYLAEHLPAWKGTEASGPENRFYYLYFGTSAMFQMGGDGWKAWNAEVRDGLIERQRRGPPVIDGSWNPEGNAMGRAMSTAMCALCLEVYYRYLPLYGGSGGPSAPRTTSGGSSGRRSGSSGPGISKEETGRRAVEQSELIRRMREADHIGGVDDPAGDE
jgi:Ca-activated chloride channel family protein